MAARQGTKTITVIPPEHEESPPEIFGQRKKPETGKYRLQVDRQTKAWYSNLEAAEAAGLVIKKAYPILQVAVYDVAEGLNKILELPNG